MTRCTFLCSGRIAGAAQSSAVVSFWIVRPGDEVISSFSWAALRVPSFVWPMVMVYVVGALAKIACEATSMIQVRLQSVYELAILCTCYPQGFRPRKKCRLLNLDRKVERRIRMAPTSRHSHETCFPSGKHKERMDPGGTQPAEVWRHYSESAHGVAGAGDSGHVQRR